MCWRGTSRTRGMAVVTRSRRILRMGCTSCTRLASSIGLHPVCSCHRARSAPLRLTSVPKPKSCHRKRMTCFLPVPVANALKIILCRPSSPKHRNTLARGAGLDQYLKCSASTAASELATQCVQGLEELQHPAECGWRGQDSRHGSGQTPDHSGAADLGPSDGHLCLRGT